MKKLIKITKKVTTQRKTAQKTGQNGAKTLKTAKKGAKIGVPRSSGGRRFSSHRSDTQKAFFLASALVISAVCIAAVVLNVYQPDFKNDSGNAPVKEAPPSANSEIEKPKQVEKQSATPSAKTSTPTASTKSNAKASQSEKTSTVSKSTTPEAKTSTPSTKTTPVAKTSPSTTSSTPAAPPVANSTVSANLGTLVFVIDDAGNNLREIEPFLNISGPLTIAVLPGLPHSAEAARRIRAAGKEVFLHQPMEALGAQNPGPGAIYCGMSADEIMTILARNIAEVGPVAGINNHQGSKVTMDREAMRTILSFCAENNLRFLDSRTTAETVAPDLARELGIKIAERNIFLDNEQNRESMSGYLSNGLERAQKNNTAVMIGHTWSPALAPLLAEQFPLLVKQGYTIKTASSIIK